jgi:uncharacterized repeat protein (TIGR03847 family)
MPHHIELNPVSHLTVGTVGEPGQRTFYLQGSRGGQLVSVIIEKQQAAMLAASIESLLEDLASKQTTEEEEDIWTDMRLREPLEPLFRVGNMGLGFNDEAQRVVLVAYELVDEGEEPSAVSFWATQSQAKALTKHAYEVVQAGRPVCGNCGQPMDPQGHFCPHRNGGHAKPSV